MRSFEDSQKSKKTVASMIERKGEEKTNKKSGECFPLACLVSLQENQCQYTMTTYTDDYIYRYLVLMWQNISFLLSWIPIENAIIIINIVVFCSLTFNCHSIQEEILSCYALQMCVCKVVNKNYDNPNVLLF